MNIKEAINKLEEYNQLFVDSFVMSKLNGTKVEINEIVIAPIDREDALSNWDEYRSKRITLDDSKSYDVYFSLEMGLSMEAPMTIEELMQEFEVHKNK